MEQTKGAIEVLKRAQKFRRERETGDICAEDLLYGLLWLAQNGAEDRELAAEATALQPALKKFFGSIDAAQKKLEQLSEKGGEGFTDAKIVLGRASELCGNGSLSAEVLRRALLERPDAVIQSLAGAPEKTEDEDDDSGTIIPFDNLNRFKVTPKSDFSGGGHEPDDDKTELTDDSLGDPADLSDFRISDFITDDDDEDKPAAGGDTDAILREMMGLLDHDKDQDHEPEKPTPGKPEFKKKTPETPVTSDSDDDTVLREMMRLLGGSDDNGDDDRERREREERERKEKEDRERRERERREEKTDDDTDDPIMRELRRLLDNGDDSDSKKYSSDDDDYVLVTDDDDSDDDKPAPPVPPTPSGKRRTKLGFFTYRGGKVAAAVKYFLLCLIVPLAILCGIDEVYPAFLESEELVVFYVVLWGYQILRGVNRVIGFKANNFVHILNALQDFLTILILEVVIASEFCGGASPMWLRALASACVLIALIINDKRFDGYTDSKEELETTLAFKSRKGSFGKIFSQYALNLLLIAAVPYAVCHSFLTAMPKWLGIVLWILAFITVWIFFFNFYDQLGEREKKYRHGKHQKIISFLENCHLGLGVTELTLLVCWLFGWLPMKLWLLIIVIAWAALSTIAGFMAAKDE